MYMDTCKSISVPDMYVWNVPVNDPRSCAKTWDPFHNQFISRQIKIFEMFYVFIIFDYGEMILSDKKFAHVITTQLP